MNELDEALALINEQRKSKTSKQIGEEVGVAEGTIRAFSTGNARFDTRGLVVKILRTYKDSVDCPYIEETIPQYECQQRSTAPEPFGGNRKHAWWLYCQTCPFKGASK